MFILRNNRVIPSFRPRFAGKCDRQSRDLTQLTSGYISRLNRLLITPDHHVRTHTWESIAQKYSMENMNIFYPLPGIDLGHLCIQVERVLHWAMPPCLLNIFTTGLYSNSSQNSLILVQISICLTHFYAK